MPSSPPFGGRRLIADTSAWTAIDRAQKLGCVPSEWIEAVEADQILTHPVVMLELLHSTRNQYEFLAVRARLEILHRIALTDSACVAAVTALGELAPKSSGYHRVGLGDALVAASAIDVNPAVGVLHYNHDDFQKLEEVLGFDNVPLAPAGSFEHQGE